ncbi:MAG: hypothetical protein EAZ32_12860 [Cytophagia bacterium]|nr:MAG: hypothetical protein EAZ46_07880 [Runella sp.]TAG18730.1 MAG: hypothetical protein EAZ38_14125 [Cytophagales bacterium]TAG38261.1 MAG: hypothetical protein EAZ32_12860 [Cytophagia bacterium]TAG48505.1 MAG: hypothetical protein EAZ29_13310 [Runella slithyformis]TAG79674.1 MAG: hypothetical protein EAZ22_11105 [Cytophagales bacterium]
MLILLILAAYLIFSYLYGYNQNAFLTKTRAAFVKTLLVLAALICGITELLSSINALSPTWLAVSWGSVCAFQLGYNRSHQTQYTFFSDLRFEWVQLRNGQRWSILVFLVLFVLPLFLLAIYVPPKNVDSINYHLARVQLWLQNANVSHFGTVFVFQLYNNVMAEYILLHVLGLSAGYDFFLQLVQFFAMIGSVSAVSLIAKQIGLNKHLQLLAGILQFSIPIGLLESTSTQNDYVACFFFLSFVYYGLQFIAFNTRTTFIWAVLSLVLGGFTKYTILVFALPYCLWIGWQVFSKNNWPEIIKKSIITVGITLVVFAPFLSRNYQLFGHIPEPLPSSPLYAYQHATEKKCLNCTLSGIVKNAGLHLSLPHLNYNKQLDELIVNLHKHLKINVNERALSLDDYSTRFVIHEDMAGNFTHFVLIIISAFVIIIRQRFSTTSKAIAICTIMGFVLFCTMLKFQLWSSRTHFPFFSAGVLVVCAALSQASRKWIMALGLLLLVMTLPYIYANSNKTILPIRMLSKYALGYIPEPMCVKNPSERALYQQKLVEYYDFSKPDACLPTKAKFNYVTRIQILKKLQNLGYFNHENESIFSQNRWQLYFTNDYGHRNYLDFKEISTKITPNTAGIGVVFVNPVGYYHYWSMFREVIGTDFKMQYVRYQKEYANLANEKRTFQYEYVLTDHLKTAKGLFVPTEIDTIYATQTLQLIKLKHVHTQKHTF